MMTNFVRFKIDFTVGFSIDTFPKDWLRRFQGIVSKDKCVADVAMWQCGPMED